MPERTKIKLAVVSGGRCEFRGCNDYLFYHPITLRDGNFSEHAHIYPFSERGTRAGQVPAPEDVHDIANLMLLCPICHEEIDSNENQYSIDVLKEMKAEHEDRIHYVTSFSSDHQSQALIVKGFVADRVSDITFDQIRKAMAPMYPADRKGFTLDLTQFGPDLDDAYFEQAETYIVQQMEKFYERGIDGGSPRHISVFAIASIPLLVLLGRHISDKIPVAFFHRHRGSDQPWRWQTGTTRLMLDVNQLQAGTDPGQVGIIVSMSGQVQRGDLPPSVNQAASLYEISVVNQPPSVRLLHTREDFQHFWQTYAALLARIALEHPSCTDLHLFLAAPPPVAMICGHERLPKVQPVLRLYDNVTDPHTNERRFRHRLSTR